MPLQYNIRFKLSRCWGVRTAGVIPASDDDDDVVAGTAGACEGDVIEVCVASGNGEFGAKLDTDDDDVPEDAEPSKPSPNAELEPPNRSCPLDGALISLAPVLPEVWELAPDSMKRRLFGSETVEEEDDGGFQMEDCDDKDGDDDDDDDDSKVVTDCVPPPEAKNVNLDIT